MRNSVALIGAAVDLGQSNSGTELAPSWLRLKGLTEVLSRKFFRIDDQGDLSASTQFNDQDELPGPTAKNLWVLNDYCQRLSLVVKEQLEKDHLVLTVGGDHSIAAGTLAGSIAYDPDIKVVWVDAHADINTPDTSPSGNVHGMPVALAMHLIDMPGCKWMPKLKPANIAYIGLRDVDPGEQKFLDDLGVLSYTAKDVKDKNISKVMHEIIDKLDPQENANFHLSFDVDGVDPKFFPSTGTPVGKGIDLFEGRKIISRLAKTGRLLALDLVEINPMIGTKEDVEKTAESTMALLDALPSWERMGDEDVIAEYLEKYQ